LSLKDKNAGVSILLCAYNSGKFLSQQLDSIASQSHVNWVVWVSDDGSQDDTAEVIESYRHAWGEHQISVQDGPRQGFALNFLSLVNDKSIQNDYYAYSDHDDIWHPSKLERAVKWLVSIPKETPALYCGRTCLVNEELKQVGFSPLFTQSPSFANAIVQSIGGGNTMLFNNAARKLLQKVDVSHGVVSHDWLTYQVVTACGGEVFYDASPSVDYRQHADNIVGANNHWRARINRIRELVRGTFRYWNASNLLAIQSLGSSLDEKGKAVIEHTKLLRSDSLSTRIKALVKLKLYRQTWLGNVGLVVAIIIKRF